MRSFSKKVFIVLVIVILGVSSIIRIVYVNSKQQTGKAYTYEVREKFEYNDFQIKVNEAKVYSADDMKAMYEEIPEEMLAEDEILIKLEVKNIANEERIFNIESFTLQIGMESGGGVDPYVYPYVNPDANRSSTFEKKEIRTVMLAFPIERTTLEKDKRLKLILSLYPEKYEIVL